ncbi:MAG TPA: universal stress protein, partial [Rhodobacteraceae bacterium]|nr:universal stress protein [Paracoccaceae bacterium]
MIKNILLPVDLNHPESSTKALAHALDIAKNHDATVHVLTVIPD